MSYLMRAIRSWPFAANVERHLGAACRWCAAALAVFAAMPPPALAQDQSKVGTVFALELGPDRTAETVHPWGTERSTIVRPVIASANVEIELAERLDVTIGGGMLTGVQRLSGVPDSAEERWEAAMASAGLRYSVFNRESFDVGVMPGLLFVGRASMLAKQQDGSTLRQTTAGGMSAALGVDLRMPGGKWKGNVGFQLSLRYFRAVWPVGGGGAIKVRPFLVGAGVVIRY